MSIPQFQFASSYSCCAEPYPDVTYTIQMKRKPLFYVFNMILPCFIITFVALLGKVLHMLSGSSALFSVVSKLQVQFFAVSIEN